jgi:outer membrane protein assembly factor BamB
MQTSLTALLMALALLPAQAQEWTRFRGPNGTGIGAADSIPLKWTENSFNWKATLPGPGHSGPVIWGNKIFLLCGNEKEGGASLLCLNTEDGHVLWSKDLPFPKWQHHKFNTLASSTPAVDAQRVYIAWSTPNQMLGAFDHDGKKLWEHDLGPHISEHGAGASPMVYRDMVIFDNENDASGVVIALDGATGKVRWQRPRKVAKTAYGTPAIYQPEGGKPQLIVNSQAHGICALDPLTGEPLWEYDKAFDKRSASCPVIADGLILGSCGSGAGGNYLVAVRPPDSSTDKAELAYEVRKAAPYVPTSLAIGKRVFLWSEAGIVTCIEAATGKEHWQERVGGNFFASPIAIGQRILNISTTGEVVILSAGDTFEVLGRNNLNELCHTTPAVAGGRLYVRTAEHLYSVGPGNAGGK